MRLLFASVVMLLLGGFGGLWLAWWMGQPSLQDRYAAQQGYTNRCALYRIGEIVHQADGSVDIRDWSVKCGLGADVKASISVGDPIMIGGYREAELLMIRDRLMP